MAAVFVALGLGLGGCTLYDMSPKRLLVKNESSQVVIVGPSDATTGIQTKSIDPGDSVAFQVPVAGCESRPWVAKSKNGVVIAQVPGACMDHIWTIRTGDLGSTYK